MLDATGKTLKEGNFILYTNASSGWLYFGYVLEIREHTRKIFISDTDCDGNQTYVNRWDYEKAERIPTSKKQTSYANYTTPNRFYILKDR